MQNHPYVCVCPFLKYSKLSLFAYKIPNLVLIRGLPILKEIWMKKPGGAVIKSLFVNNDFIWQKLPLLLNRL